MQNRRKTFPINKIPLLKLEYFQLMKVRGLLYFAVPLPWPQISFRSQTYQCPIKTSQKVCNYPSATVENVNNLEFFSLNYAIINSKYILDKFMMKVCTLICLLLLLNLIFKVYFSRSRKHPVQRRIILDLSAQQKFLSNTTLVRKL